MPVSCNAMFGSPSCGHPTAAPSGRSCSGPGLELLTSPLAFPYDETSQGTSLAAKEQE